MAKKKTVEVDGFISFPVKDGPHADEYEFQYHAVLTVSGGDERAPDTDIEVQPSGTEPIISDALWDEMWEEITEMAAKDAWNQYLSRNPKDIKKIKLAAKIQRVYETPMKLPLHNPPNAEFVMIGRGEEADSELYYPNDGRNDRPSPVYSAKIEYFEDGPSYHLTIYKGRFDKVLADRGSFDSSDDAWEDANSWLYDRLSDIRDIQSPEVSPNPPHIIADHLAEASQEEMLREAIASELDAINLYETMARGRVNGKIRSVLLDVANEEKTHVGEFQALLLELDKEQKTELAKGEKEVSKIDGGE